MKKRLILFSIALTTVAAMILIGCGGETGEKGGGRWFDGLLEDKIIWQGTIDNAFTDNELILITDKFFRHKTFTIRDFPMIEAEKVKLVADYSQADESGNKIYAITLRNRGKKNVIDAVRELEKYPFAKVVEPNLIAWPVDDCGGETGVKGEKDNSGEKGRDGLSAYEIYCKNYIYIESEKQWIDDLVAGRLEHKDNSVLQEKTIWQGTINDDFTDNEILLITDKYYRRKTFTVADFHMIKAEKVELIADYSAEDKSGNQIYVITLKDSGKQNVIDAIRKLEIYAFAMAVEPNMLYTLASGQG